MKGRFKFAFSYLVSQKLRAVSMVISLSILTALPMSIESLLNHLRDDLLFRSRSTPLLLTAPHQQLEGFVKNLYFSQRETQRLSFGDLFSMEDGVKADLVPLIVEHRVHREGDVASWPLVGTSSLYFEKRGIEMVRGDLMSKVGDVVVGQTLAEEHGLKLGDALFVVPAYQWDFARSQPYRLNVVGVFSQQHSSDDGAIFGSLETSWILSGHGHGHDAGTKEHGSDGDLNLHLSLMSQRLGYSTFTPKNISQFHFHGERTDLPLDGCLVFPKDSSEHLKALLVGRNDPKVDVLEPFDQAERIVSSMFDIRRMAYILYFLLCICLAPLLLVLILSSVQLRRQEWRTLHILGYGRRSCVGLVVREWLVYVGFTCLLNVTVMWIITNLDVMNLMDVMF